MWTGTLATIPGDWVLCDGTNSTPDLRLLFIRGTPAGIDPGTIAGSDTHVHTFSGNTGLAVGLSVRPGTSAGNASSPSHSHSLAAVTTNEGDNVPAYYAVAFIMKT